MTDKEFNDLIQEMDLMEFVEPVSKIKEAATKVIESTPTADVPKAKTKKRKSAINDSELDMMFADIKATFAVSFKNKDLAPLLDKWGLSARQTPSRLKKLVDAGLLSDLGGSPKSYEVV